MQACGENFRIIKESDYDLLVALTARNRSTAATALEAALALADIVPDVELPAYAVTMHSEVRFVDTDSDNETTLTLVLPWQAVVAQMKISVLSPLGSALIGRCVGSTASWPLLNGRQRRLRVTAVTQTAPAAGVCLAPSA